MAGLPSDYSQLANFDTGLFSPDDWKATWITGMCASPDMCVSLVVGGRPVHGRGRPRNFTT